MSAPVLNKRIEMALRIAISNGGTLSYNPDMYRLGFADNIPPSSRFNVELEKYGTIHYDYSMDMYDSYSSFSEAWESFTINERGREAIKAIDKERNGTFGLKKLLRFLWSAFWSLLGYGLGIIVFCIAAYYLASIDYSQVYSWYMGIWHAIFVVPNFLLHHCYDSDILYFAEEHTTAYSVFFWIIFVTSILPGILQYLKNLIVDLLKQWFKPF